MKIRVSLFLSGEQAYKFSRALNKYFSCCSCTVSDSDGESCLTPVVDQRNEGGGKTQVLTLLFAASFE